MSSPSPSAANGLSNGSTPMSDIPPSSSSSAPSSIPPPPPTPSDDIVLSLLRQRGYSLPSLSTLHSLLSPHFVTSATPSLSNLHSSPLHLGEHVTSSLLDINLSPTHLLSNTYSERDIHTLSYEDSYSHLLSFIHNSLDIYQSEMSSVLWPLYCYSYINLLSLSLVTEATAFLAKFRYLHFATHSIEIISLTHLTHPDHLLRSEYTKVLLSRKQEIMMSEYSLELLLSFCEEKNLKIILKIINFHINIRVVSKRPYRVEFAMGSNQINNPTISAAAVNNAPAPSSSSSSSSMSPSPSLSPPTVTLLKDSLLSSDSTLSLHPTALLSSFRWGVTPEISQIYTTAVDLVKDKLREIHAEAMEEKGEETKTNTMMRDDENREKENGGKKQKLSSPSADPLHSPSLSPSDLLHQAKSKLSTELKSLLLSRYHSLPSYIEGKSREEDAFILLTDQIETLSMEKVGPPPSRVIDPTLSPNIEIPSMTDSMKLSYLSDLMYRYPLDDTHLPSIAMVHFDTQYNVMEMSTDGGLIASTGSVSAPLDPIIHVHDMEMNTLMTNTDYSQYSIPRMVSKNDGKHKQLIGHSQPVTSLSFYPANGIECDFILSASLDNYIKLWNISLSSCLLNYIGHQFPIYSVDFSPLGFYFSSSSADRTVRLWATDRTSPLRILSGHIDDVNIAKFHPNCNYIASASYDNSIRLWDLQSGETVRILRGGHSLLHLSVDKNSHVKHPSSPYHFTSLSFHPEGRLLASADSSGHILIWDVSSSRVVTDFQHGGDVTQLSFSAENEYLSSVGTDGAVRVWNVKKGKEREREKERGEGGEGEGEGGKDSALVAEFPTKDMSFTNCRFTRRNLLLVGGYKNEILNTARSNQ